MGTGSFPGVRCGRGVTLTPHPLLVQRSKQSRAIPLLSLRAFVAYETVKPTYTYFIRTFIWIFYTFLPLYFWPHISWFWYASKHTPNQLINICIYIYVAYLTRLPVAKDIKTSKYVYYWRMMNRKESGTTWSWPISKEFPGARLAEQKKTMKYLSKGSWRPSRFSNQTPLWYK